MSRLPGLVALLPLPYLLFLAASVTGVVALPTQRAGAAGGSVLVFLVLASLLGLLAYLPHGPSHAVRILGSIAYSLALFGGTGLGAVEGVLFHVGGLDGREPRSLRLALLFGAGAVTSALGLFATAGLVVRELRREER